MRSALRRAHVWLGWVVGVPLLFWTVSGLWMVARPIEDVRGTALRAVPPPLALSGRLVPPRDPRPVATLQLGRAGGGPAWLIGYPDGTAGRADARTGAALPPVSATEAPVDLRQARPAWQVAFADGVRVYVDAETGAVLALRTRQWRAFDWMWGLHIMDLKGREDSSHPILIGFAAVSALSVVLALLLLPKRRTKPVKITLDKTNDIG